MLEESMSSTTVPSSIWASIFSWFTPTVFFVFLNLTIGTIYFTSSSASNNPAPAGVNGDDGGKQNEGEEETPKLVRSPSVLQRLKSINYLNSYRSQEPVSATAFASAGGDDDVHFSFRQQLTPEHDQRQQHQQPPLDRSPSVSQKLKSFNFHGYFSPEQPTPLNNNQGIYSHYTPEPEQASEPEEEDEQKQETEEEVEEINNQDEGIQGEEKITLDEIYSRVEEINVEPASGEVPTYKIPRKMKKSASVKFSPFSHSEEEEIVEARRPDTVREGKAKATEEDDEVDARADDFINKFKQQLKLQRIDSILGKRRL